MQITYVVISFRTIVYCASMVIVPELSVNLVNELLLNVYNPSASISVLICSQRGKILAEKFKIMRFLEILWPNYGQHVEKIVVCRYSQNQ